MNEATIQIMDRPFSCALNPATIPQAAKKMIAAPAPMASLLTPTGRPQQSSSNCAEAYNGSDGASESGDVPARSPGHLVFSLFFR